MYFKDRCAECGTCLEVCPSGAIFRNRHGEVVTDAQRCTQCGTCIERCAYAAREMIGQTFTVGEVMEVIERDRLFYDESGGGVTFSGGEPLYQPRFLLALLEACGESEIHRTVDTTGFVAPPILARIHAHVDLFLYDLKLMDEARHRHYTGVSNALILSNLRWLSGEGHSLVIRTPLISGINDDHDNAVRMGEFVASLHGPPQIDLLPYHAIGSDKYSRLTEMQEAPSLQTPSPEKVEEIASLLRGFDIRVTVGGQ